MYADWTNQTTQLLRFIASFVALYLVIPRLFWPDLPGSPADRFWQGLLRMVAGCIALVYCLVLAALYEVLALVFCFLGYAIWQLRKNRDRRQAWRGLISRFSTGFYNWLDGLIRPWEHLRQQRQATLARLAKEGRLRRPDGGDVLSQLLFLGVGAYSAWLRLYDAMRHAAPAMSDAYVTLAWMKYIERRTLFHDGIYPQGFHIVLSTLHKFAGQDALYTLKYAGPCSGVLTVCGIYYVVWKLSGQRSAALVAAFCYGALGAWLPLEWQRQASTNSQEFAIIFLLPTWYWLHRYWLEGKRADWWTAFAGSLCIGWVHALVYCFLLFGLGCLALSHLATDWRTALARAPAMFTLAALSCLLAVLPLGVGLLLGQELHQTSLDFVTSRLAISSPATSWLDWLALFGAFGWLCLNLFRRSAASTRATCLATLVGGSFCFYQLAGPLSGNAVLATRSNLLWSLSMTVGIGLAFATACCLLGWSVQHGRGRLTALATACACCLAVWLLQPLPPTPYKMQPDNMVEQYLRIANEFRPTEWMIVSSDEGYALALGQGFHLQLTDWLRDYSASSELLQRAGDEQPELMLTPDVFLFLEKTVFRTDFDHLASLYQRRAREYAQLSEWLLEYASQHDNLSLYYQDQDLEIWRINQADLLASRKLLVGRDRGSR